MTNAYPDFPFVPYQQTSVAMADVVNYLRATNCHIGIKRCAYVMFRNESGNGKFGVNNNYGGFQADGGRWPSVFDNYITGVVSKDENKTGRQRLFLAFRDWQDSVELLVNRIRDRNLYIGTTEIKNVAELMSAYAQQWVGRDALTESEQTSFISMYGQAVEIFTAANANLAGETTPMGAAEILALVQALISLVPQAQTLVPIIEKMVAGQDPTADDIAQIQTVTASLNAQAADAEARAGATGPTE